MKKKCKHGESPSLFDIPKILRIMRLTCLFMMLLLTHVSASSYSQSKKLNLSAQDLSIKQIFDLIEKQSDFSLFYNVNSPGLAKKINIKAKDQSIEKVLDAVLKDTELTYSVNDKLIVIHKRNKNEAKEINIQQAREVKGKVTDGSGEPLPGVSVVVKGTTIGITTDFDGNYSLEVPAGGEVLVFSFVGMIQQEIAIEGRTTISLALREDTKDLDEVVVVGYGVQKKESLTSSITSVETEKLESRSTANLTGAMQGLTPGLYIRQASGRPGADPVSIDIRGASRGTFSSNPALVIIDGIPSDFNSVAPQDIENISILKDAAAAAIYGSRASGGVVLITTKKGKTGGIKINYSGQVGLQSSPILNNLDFLNTAEFMRFANVAEKNDAIAKGSTYNPVWTDADIAEAEAGNGRFPTESEWTDWIPESVFMQNHNVSLRGGSDILTYYASMGFLEQQGIIPDDEFSRKSIQLNLDYAASEKLDIGLKLSYVREDHESPSYNSNQGYYSVLRTALLTDPTKPFQFDNGQYNHDVWASAGNPIYLLKNGGTNESENDLFRGGIDFSYEIIEGLKFKAAAGGRISYNMYNSLTKKLSLYNEDGSLLRNEPTKTSVSESFSKGFYYNTQLLLDYTKKIGDHNFYAMGGYTTEQSRSDNLGGYANYFINNELREINASIGGNDDQDIWGSASEWALASVIGRVSYDYKSKYFIEGNFRYDGSSRFSPEQRYGFFPSVSGAWRISEESFMKNIKSLSNLKLRASWGQLGNQGSNLYPFAQSINIDSNVHAFGSSTATGVFTSNPVDLGLTWEEKTSRNIAIDFGFFDNKLTGSFDYFVDQTDDIITRPSAPPTFGASAPIQNAWSIKNKGFEFEVNWQEKRGDFTYSFGLNLSDTKDKVLKFKDGNTVPGLDVPAILSGSSFIAEGYSRNELYGYRTDGLYVDQAEIDADGNLYNVRPGEIKYIDANNDGKLNGDDRRPLGKSSTPHYSYGFNFAVKYKQIDIAAIFNGVGSRWGFRNSGGTYMLGYRPGPAILRNVAESAWSIENPDKHADWTRPTNDFGRLFGGYWAFGAKNEYHMRNYSYLRLKNLQIGYNVPQFILRSLGVEKLRVYFTGENLFTIANGFNEPVDPEADQTYTNDARTYLSNLRTLSLGLNITF